MLLFYEAKLVVVLGFMCYDLSMSDTPKIEENPASLPAAQARIVVSSEQQQIGVVAHHETDEIENITNELAGTGIKPAKEAVPPSTTDSGLIILPNKTPNPSDTPFGTHKFEKLKQEKIRKGLPDAA